MKKLFLLFAFITTGLVSANTNSTASSFINSSNDSSELFQKLMQTRYTFMTTCGETISFVSDSVLSNTYLESYMLFLNVALCDEVPDEINIDRP